MYPTQALIPRQGLTVEQAAAADTVPNGYLDTTARGPPLLPERASELHSPAGHTPTYSPNGPRPVGLA